MPPGALGPLATPLSISEYNRRRQSNFKYYWRVQGWIRWWSDWGNRPRITSESNFIHHDSLQFGKQHSRYKAILSSIILSQQCYEVYIFHLSFKSETVMRLDCQISQKSPPITLLAGFALGELKSYRTKWWESFFRLALPCGNFKTSGCLVGRMTSALATTRLTPQLAEISVESSGLPI